MRLIECEAFRVAIAFQRKEFSRGSKSRYGQEYFTKDRSFDNYLNWLLHDDGSLCRILVKDTDIWLRPNGTWRVDIARKGKPPEFLARGLYRLGFDEAILSELQPLTAHEQLELRLSTPRHFWPQRWADEITR